MTNGYVLHLCALTASSSPERLHPCQEKKLMKFPRLINCLCVCECLCLILCVFRWE